MSTERNLNINTNTMNMNSAKKLNNHDNPINSETHKEIEDLKKSLNRITFNITSNNQSIDKGIINENNHDNMILGGLKEKLMNKNNNDFSSYITNNNEKKDLPNIPIRYKK